MLECEKNLETLVDGNAQEDNFTLSWAFYKLSPSSLIYLKKVQCMIEQIYISHIDEVFKF